MTIQYYAAQFTWDTTDGHLSGPQTEAFSGTTIDWAHNRVFLWNGHYVRAYDISTFGTFYPYASASWPTNQLETVMGVRVAPDGYLLCSFSSQSTIFKLDPLTLASVGQFGPGSYPHGIGGTNTYDGAIAPIMVNGVPYAQVKQVVGGYSGLIRTDTMTAAGFYQQLTGGWFGNGILCSGASGTSSGSIYLIDEYDLGNGNVTLNVYKITVAAGAETYNISSWPTPNPYVSYIHSTLVPTDIDPSWTTIEAESIGYDAKNNVVLLQLTQFAAQDQRFVGLDGDTLAVKWAIQPFSGRVWSPDLAQSRVQNGYIALVSNGNFFAPNDTLLKTINTSDGSTYSSDTTYGLGTLYRSFSSDDVSGGVVVQTVLQNVTGHPTLETGTSFSNAPPQSMMQPLIIRPANLVMDDLNCEQQPLPTDNMVTLRWSDDGGYSWSNGLEQSLGNIGEYLTSVQFRRLGMARNRVWEVSWSGALPEALNGLSIQFQTAAT